ncbi:histone deacetylase complex, catalytic component RPD3 [Pisolithus marmoratus]|nr:histone deacetylase complex, catalytic component RPD3 [Pisolithus marmoratus]
MSKRRMAYYHDGVMKFQYLLRLTHHGIRITHDLVSTQGILHNMHVLASTSSLLSNTAPKRATLEAMTAFRADEYINPAFEGVFESRLVDLYGSLAFCLESISLSISSGESDIAINWASGLHCSEKREALGFCYINGIVLGILELSRSYPPMLYIDIGSFYTTDRVMTCSLHKFGEYFPGKNYAANVLLKDGTRLSKVSSNPVVSKITDVYQPSAVVLQCGADFFAGDKLGCFNLTMHGHASCVRFLRQLNAPLILCSGGYAIKNVARTWTYEAACALGIENEINRNLPWYEYFDWFAPRYCLDVSENNMDELNVKDRSPDRVWDNALQQLS